MNRRTIVLAGLLGSLPFADGIAQQPELTVIYVGGWDCGPCINWKNTKKADWLASKERSRVRYVEIEAPKLKEAYQDQYWPQELRAIRDQLAKKSGTPRFVIVRGDKVISSEWGAGEWDRTQQKLRELLA